MAAPLTIHTPLGFEVIRAGATLAVSARFDPGAPPFDPRRRPREIVMELLDAGGRAVGAPIRLLGPRPAVSFRDVGVFFKGMPVMVYGMLPIDDAAAGDCQVRITVFPEAGPDAVAAAPIRVHAPTSAPIPMTSPAPFLGDFELQVLEPDEGRRFFPGEPIAFFGRTRRTSKVAYFYTLIVDDRASDVVHSTYVARWELGPVVRRRTDGARFAIDLMAPNLPFDQRGVFTLLTYIVRMDTGAVAAGGRRHVNVGFPTQDGSGPHLSAFPIGLAGAAHDSPRVDLNRDDQAELTELRGIGKVIAQRIVDARPFATVDDLRKVDGIGEALMEQLRPMLRV